MPVDRGTRSFLREQRLWQCNFVPCFPLGMGLSQSMDTGKFLVGIHSIFLCLLLVFFEVCPEITCNFLSRGRSDFIASVDTHLSLMINEFLTITFFFCSYCIEELECFMWCC